MSNDPGEPTRPVPTPGSDVDPWKAFQVVPATPDPPQPTPVDNRPTEALPSDPYKATVVQPASVAPVAAALSAQPARPAQYVPVEPVAAVRREVVEPDRRSTWIAVAAVVALMVGGLVGYLIGNSSAGGGDSLGTTDTATLDSAAEQAAADQRVNDVFTLLAAQARQPDGIQTPTPYPALDDLLTVLAGANPATTVPAETTTPDAPADGEVAALTTERDALKSQVESLQGQVTSLESELATTQTALMELQATVSSNGSNDAELQSKIDDQAKQISTLQNDLNSANGQLSKAQTDLETAQAELATASAKLSDLNPLPVDNFVGQDIAKVRATVKANGWTIVERQIDSPSAQPNSVTLQSPAPGSTMVKGSVVYVEIVKSS